MKHEPVIMYSREWLEHERRKAWQEGYAAGWKDQECDFPPHTSDNPYLEDTNFALQPVSLGPNFIAFAVDVPVQPCKNGEIGPFTRKTTTSDGTTALTYYKLTDDFAKRLDEAIKAFKTKLTEPEATK